jgi:hypothetical protein
VGGIGCRGRRIGRVRVGRFRGKVGGREVFILVFLVDFVIQL